MVRGDEAGRPFHVLDHEAGLTGNEPHQVPRHHARRGVDATARRKADDHRERLALIEVVGTCCPRQNGGERGHAQAGESAPARWADHHYRSLFGGLHRDAGGVNRRIHIGEVGQAVVQEFRGLAG